MKRLKIAFIGSGYMASEHAKAFSAFEETELVGVCSRTKEKRAAFARKFNIKKEFDTIEQLYHHTKADFVIICVPELSLNKVIKSAFKFPWGILLEKPAGYNFEDALDIYECYKKLHRNKVFVGMNRRFYQSCLHAKKSLDSSNSESRFVHIRDQESIEGAIEIGQPRLVAENYMYANSIHLIDLFNFFCRGKIKRINHILPWNGPGTTLVLCCIQYDSGDVAMYEGIWQGPAPWSCSITTKSNRFLMEPIEHLQVQKAGERQKTSMELPDIDNKFKAGIFEQARNLICAMKGQPSDSVTIDQSLESMELVRSIFKEQL